MSTEPVMDVGDDPVMPLPGLGRRIDVDRDAGGMRHVVQDLVSHFLRDRVALSHGELGVHHDVYFKGEAMSDPSATDLRHLVDA
jgi:hypothetical protein